MMNVRIDEAEQEFGKKHTQKTVFFSEGNDDMVIRKRFSPKRIRAEGWSPQRNRGDHNAHRGEVAELVRMP